MLVLSRKKSEAICIGDEVVLKIIEVRGNTVRIGIEAPDSVSIIRSELLLEVEDDHDEDAVMAGVAHVPNQRRHAR